MDIMKRLISLSTLLFLIVNAQAQYRKVVVLTPSVRPNAAQQVLMRHQYGKFIHFGVNTFSDLEWPDGCIPASAYNPTQIDCDQWVRVARDAGFSNARINRIRCYSIGIWKDNKGQQCLFKNV